MSEQTYSPRVILFPDYIPLPMSEKLMAAMEKKLSAPSELELQAYGPKDVYHEAYFVMCGGQFHVIELARQASNYTLMHGAGMLASEWLDDPQHKEVRRKNTLAAKENIEYQLNSEKEVVIPVGSSVWWLIPELFTALTDYMSLTDNEESTIQNTGKGNNNSAT